MCEQWNYLSDTNLSAEKKGDVLEVCFGLFILNACYRVNLMKFHMDATNLHDPWNMQWAMLGRDIYLSTMGGLEDLRIKHPDAANITAMKHKVVPCRIESACKYYTFITKLKFDETMQWVVVESVNQEG